MVSVGGDCRERSPCNQSFDKIEQLAGIVAKKKGLRDGARLIDIVQQLGGDIDFSGDANLYNESLTTWRILEIRSKEDFAISMPVGSRAVLDRYNIAFCLGHYFLLFLEEGEGASFPVCAYISILDEHGNNSANQEAVVFADAFLIDGDELKEEFKYFDSQRKGKEDREDLIEPLKLRFNVPGFAIRRRLERLGL